MDLGKINIIRLHGIVPSRPQNSRVLSGKEIKKNKQQQYDRPKKYVIGSWQDKYNKIKEKAQKADDKKYGEDPDYQY